MRSEQGERFLKTFLATAPKQNLGLCLITTSVFCVKAHHVN